MPETMSVERRKLIASYGATLILTEGKLGMTGAIKRAGEMVKEDKKYFMPDQFNNLANPEFHYMTTAEEIIMQLNDLDIFTAAVGTGGTLVGVSRKLKEFNKKIIVAE